MSVLRQLLLVSCTAILLLTLTPGARASDWDQKVIATFDAPVEIPGHVLPTGTYVFKLFDMLTPDLVQVSNADESQILALTFSIPRYRANPTDKVAFLFEERGSDSPQAIQAWFYPGYTGGHQFIYRNAVTPNAEATAVAPSVEVANSADTPALPDEVAAIQPYASEGSSPAVSDEANANEPAPEVLPQSTQNTDQNQITQSQTTPNTSTTPDTSTTPADKELPKTASTMPLIALIGLLSLGGAVALKMFAARIS